MKIVAIIALVLLGIALLLARATYQKIEAAKVARGKVTELYRSRSSKGGSTYGIIATFPVGSASYTYRSGWTSSSPGYAVGDEVRIYYDPDAPDRNGLFSLWGAYALPLVLGLIAGLMLAISVTVAYSPELMLWLHGGKILELER